MPAKRFPAHSRSCAPSSQKASVETGTILSVLAGVAGERFSDVWTAPVKTGQVPQTSSNLLPYIDANEKCNSYAHAWFLGQHLHIYYAYIHNITLHYITLHYLTLPYLTLHYITLHYITLHTLHYITLHYITLHCIALHCITLHYITLHYIHANSCQETRAHTRPIGRPIEDAIAARRTSSKHTPHPAKHRPKPFEQAEPKHLPTTSSHTGLTKRSSKSTKHMQLDNLPGASASLKLMRGGEHLKQKHL